MSHSSYRISEQVYEVLKSRKSSLFFQDVIADVDNRNGLWYVERVNKTLFYLYTHPYEGVYGTRDEKELSQIDEYYFNGILVKRI